MNKEVVIVSAARTPAGRYGGALKDINTGTLGALVVKEAVARAGLTAQQIDEVILGEARQTTESSNVARIAALRAGLPAEVPAFTINRLCASGMQAAVSAVQQIRSEQAEIVVAGGVESMSRSPIYLRNALYGEGNPYVVDSNLECGQQPQETYGDRMSMGVTAENVAERCGISREDQDRYALESQLKAARAIENGVFRGEILPVEAKKGKMTIVVEQDEPPRPDSSLEALAKLRPAFKPDGTVTAGNACGRSDGAAAMVLMSRDQSEALGLAPLVKIADWATVGVAPDVMGIGPVPAIRKLLRRTGLSLADIGLLEINEAFASQCLAVIRELQLDSDKVNVNGGAIALGHPLGASGARIMMTLAYEMQRRNERYGIASLCVGGGQGMAVLLERV